VGAVCCPFVARLRPAGAPAHPLSLHDALPIFKALAREPAGGLIFPPDTFTAAHRKLIIELAAHYHMPALYASRLFAAEGGKIKQIGRAHVCTPVTDPSRMPSFSLHK